MTECSICCELCKNFIICPNCSHIFCINCQRKFAKDECINCHITLTHKFLVEHLGKNFINDIIKPHIIEKLMIEQKNMLKYVQPLAEWEKQSRIEMKKKRFGIRPELPPRPTINKTMQNDLSIFQCPIPNCRGFVEKGSCSLCHAVICMRCHEKQDENHVCKVENLQSLALLSGDSKPCPRCCALIFRIEGCNHMFCTNCHTYFDWQSGQVTGANTNSHYLGLKMFSENIPLRDIKENSKQNNCDDVIEFSVYRDGVPKQLITDITNIMPELLYCLWEDSNSVRLAKKHYYNERDIVQKHSYSEEEFQIKFLLGDIDEKYWARLVYQLYCKKNLNLLYAEVLNIYLSVVDSYQKELVIKNNNDITVRKDCDQKQMLINYGRLVDLSNKSFESIQEQYGGNLHHIRHPSESQNNPPFI